MTESTDKNNQPTDGAQNSPVAEPSEIEELKKKLSEQQNKYLYLYAELENFKKRSQKEKADLLKFGQETFAREILTVTDNLERAADHTENIESLVSGIKLVVQQFHNILARFGVTPLDSVGQPFDPETQEAVAQEPSENDGVVLREQQKGYSIHGRLLRPARVVVGRKDISN